MTLQEFKNTIAKIEADLVAKGVDVAATDVVIDVDDTVEIGNMYLEINQVEYNDQVISVVISCS